MRRRWTDLAVDRLWTAWRRMPRKRKIISLHIHRDHSFESAANIQICQRNRRTQVRKALSGSLTAHVVRSETRSRAGEARQHNGHWQARGGSLLSRMPLAPTVRGPRRCFEVRAGHPSGTHPNQTSRSKLIRRQLSLPFEVLQLRSG